MIEYELVHDVGVDSYYNSDYDSENGNMDEIFGKSDK